MLKCKKDVPCSGKVWEGFSPSTDFTLVGLIPDDVTIRLSLRGIQSGKKKDKKFSGTVDI